MVDWGSDSVLAGAQTHVLPTLLPGSKDLHRQLDSWDGQLYVSLTEPLGAQLFVKHYSGCLWGCFWIRKTFEQVDGVRQITLLSVGQPHPIHWIEQKGWGGSDLCLTVGELGHRSSPAFGLGLGLKFTPSALLVLRLLHLDLKVHRPLSWLSSLVMAHPGTSGFRAHVSQFLVTSL